MPRNGSGVYSLPATNPVVPFTTIETLWANGTLTDLATAVTQSIASTGVTPAAANLPMAGFVHTGVGEATLYNQYARADQVQRNAFNTLYNVTVDAAQLLYTAEMALDAGASLNIEDGTPVVWIPPQSNLGPAQIQINGSFPFDILNSDGSPLSAGKILQLKPCSMVYVSPAFFLVAAADAGTLSVASDDEEVLGVTQVLTDVTLSPRTNLSNGGVKLTALTKIPVALLPFDSLTLLGVFNANPGVNPADGTATGQYYIVSEAGSLTLYVDTGAGYVPTGQGVVPGDVLLWLETAPFTAGWYYVSEGPATAAASVVNIATPSFAAGNLQDWIDEADAVGGFVLTDGTRPFTGAALAPSFHALSNGIISTNLYYDGAWKFLGAGYGQMRLIDTVNGGFIDYVTSNQGAAPGDAATIVDVSYQSANAARYSYANTPYGVGNPPRAPAAVQYHLDVYGAGSRRFVLQDNTGLTALKFQATAAACYIDNLRMAGDGSTSPVAGVPLIVRVADAAGTLDNMIYIGNNRTMYIGNNAASIPGAIVSTYRNLGVVAGAVDFLQYQTAAITAGSNVTAITMASGQVARIYVVGAGAITLPGTVRIPTSGTSFGTFGTMINLFNAAGTIFATFIPYN